MAFLEQRLSDMADNVLLLTGELSTVQSAMYATTSPGWGGGGGGSSTAQAPAAVVTLSATSGRNLLSAEAILRARARGMVAEGMMGTQQGVQLEHFPPRSGSPVWGSSGSGSGSGGTATQTDCEAQVQTEGGGEGGVRRSQSPLQRSMAAAREVIRRTSLGSGGGGGGGSGSSGGSGGKRSSSASSRPPWDSTNTPPQPALGSLRSSSRGSRG